MAVHDVFKIVGVIIVTVYSILVLHYFFKAVEFSVTYQGVNVSNQQIESSENNINISDVNGDVVINVSMS